MYLIFFWGVYITGVSISYSLLFCCGYYAMLSIFKHRRRCRCRSYFFFFFYFGYLCGSLFVVLKQLILCVNVQHSFVWHLTFCSNINSSFTLALSNQMCAKHIDVRIDKCLWKRNTQQFSHVGQSIDFQRSANFPTKFEKLYKSLLGKKKKKIYYALPIKMRSYWLFFSFLSSVKCHRSGQDERVFCYCTYTHPIPSKTTINCVTLSVDSFFFIFFFFGFSPKNTHTRKQKKKSHFDNAKYLYSRNSSNHMNCS